MPNSYTIAPGTVVGKLTTSDDISAASGQPQRAHINSGASLAGVGFNINPVSLVRDNGAAPAYYLYSQPGVDGFRLVFISAAGQSKGGAVPYEAINNNSLPANTGNTTENTVFSSSIRAGQLLAMGYIALEVYISTTVQGGVASTFRLKLGATVLSSFTTTTVNERIWRVTCCNANATNAQVVLAEVQNNGANPTVATAAAAVDTTADQVLSLTIQNGAASDSHIVRVIRGFLIGTTGAV